MDAYITDITCEEYWMDEELMDVLDSLTDEEWDALAEEVAEQMAMPVCGWEAC